MATTVIINNISNKKKSYKCDLVITNGNNPISSYHIECTLPPNSQITKCSKFEIQTKDNIVILTPSSKNTINIKSNDIVAVKMQGTGSPPTSLLFVTTPSPPVPPNPPVPPVPIPSSFIPGSEPTQYTPSNIMLELVSIAENSSTDWKKQINYIENIKDGRGYTISIVGFCTGTGDFIQVLEEIQKIDPSHVLVPFIPLVQKVDGTSSVKGLEQLPSVMKSIGTDDPVFIQAMWTIIDKLYWGPALDYCSKFNLPSNLSKYIAYDTILNFGDLDKLQSIKASSETEFLTSFLNLKQTIIEQDKSLGDSKNNRVDMQKKLLQQGNLTLSPPMTVSCYGDTFTITS